MRTRIVCVVLAALSALPCGAGAQRAPETGGSLRAFRSDRELVRFLDDAEEPPRVVPAPAAPQPAPHPAPPPQPPLPCTAPASAPPASPVDVMAAVVTGVVTNAAGCAEAAVLVRIESLNAGASTGADGSFRLVVPADRVTGGRSVTLTAVRVGLSPVSRSITLAPGARLTQNFQMAAEAILLEDVVVTGTAGAVTGRLMGASITNVQHAGVDEGGIVKLHGRHLVILRRGRLFTVRVGGGDLTPVSVADAYGPEYDGDAWYDELLVSGDNVVVIGYSYGRGGTEIGLFRIDGEGRLRYRETYHLRSDDYYSDRNYASRLVGDRLVMYTPVPAGGPMQPDQHFPALRRWREGAGDDEFRRILPARRVYRPGVRLAAHDHPTLHTVISCDLSRPRMDCEATAVLGPAGRVFYVSPKAVYVWASGWAGRDEKRPPSMVYRLPLDGSAPAALQAEGSPVDQFSFLESDDGHLNVLVRSGARGDRMWDAEFARGDVRLLRVSIRRFGNGRGAAPARAYRALPAPADGPFHNRFAGPHLLYGTGNGWSRPRAHRATLYAVRWRDGTVAEVPLEHGVDRIEVMGPDAVVVGADTADLFFTGIRLANGRPRAAQRYVQRGAQQGETRSHGFFYRADAPDQGVIGLPVRGPGRPGYEHLFDESASVLFLENRDAGFRPLGELAANPEGETNDHCVASCVDWYGNARPLFLGGRVLALLGYEIVEGAVVDGRIREVNRARFTPSAETVAARK